MPSLSSLNINIVYILNMVLYLTSNETIFPQLNYDIMFIFLMHWIIFHLKKDSKSLNNNNTDNKRWNTFKYMVPPHGLYIYLTKGGHPEDRVTQSYSHWPLGGQNTEV